jgi:hypothetical protein
VQSSLWFYKILVIIEHQELNLNFCDNVCFLPVGYMNYGSINSQDRPAGRLVTRQYTNLSYLHTIKIGEI